ncbi:unnamed protein product [Leptidea sinapis]|uniref:Protein sel-1 homolog 1 n=1 Tax=Leptidea sinapis TaxID=189913 RepID=A0A5E4PRD3_9NEOP|nr:unnamed protein product [Leptidea sinapis]
MKYFHVYVFMLCILLTTAELVGPESPQKDKTNDNDETTETTVTEGDAYNLMKREINLLQEYAKAIREAKELLKEDQIIKGDQDEKEENANLEFMNIYSLKTGQTLFKDDDLGWLESAKSTKSDTENDYENPQDILNKLAPLPEEEEEDLSPKMQEAKILYDAAVMKIKKRTPDLRGAILQVKQAAEKGYAPAKIKLAWSYIFGEGVELNLDKARKIFEGLSEYGHAEGHAGLGFLHATGLGVPVSQAKALVYYQMGAIGDSDFAQMALGYRYWQGVTVPNSCNLALQLYMRVASKVARQITYTGGGAVQRTRLTDEGEGALDTDLIEYYQLLAEKGDVQAQVGLGQLHFQGGRGVTLDLQKALHYFQQAASAGNSIAHGYLGKIYLEGGDGIQANNETALNYFKKAAELNNPIGQSGMGLMYLQGRGVPKDPQMAFKYFTMAANQGWAEGQLHLGFLYFSGTGVRRDFKQANKYFSLASQSGHVLALYHLAQLHAQGLGVMRSCTTATELFKNVCERGPWSSRLMLAHAAFRARDSDAAFLQYSALAERGYEIAQTNAAYLLDEGEVRMFGSDSPSSPGKGERWSRALQLWSRAAAQGCAAARVKLGDYHYYGLGTALDLEAAAHHYRIASENLHNAQATFNLGYMHERGLGLSRDIHLAKRCYDLAAEASPDARLPAALALARLTAVTAMSSVLDSPLAVIFITGESTLLCNWDVYLIALLAAALALVLYLRRPRQPAGAN